MEAESARVTVVISDLGPGGAQRVVTNLVNAWSVREAGEVTLITFADPATDFYSVDPGVRRVAIGGQRDSGGVAQAFRANLLRIWRLRQAVKSTGCGTVVSFIGATNVLTVLATLGLRPRVVISERNDPARQRLGRVWDLLRRLTYRFADVVTANSRGALGSMSTFVPQRKLAFVPNPVVVPDDQPAAALAHPTVLTVGRLSHQKAHEVLLRAFAHVGTEFSEWRLLIIGDGPRREELRAEAAALGIHDRVEWLARTDAPFSYYRAADIFALPSRFEGTPNVLLEAMACGLASVIADASPGPLEWISSEVNGLVVPVDDDRALADALAGLMRDADLRGRLGAAARETVEAHDLPRALDVWDYVLGLTRAG